MSVIFFLLLRMAVDRHIFFFCPLTVDTVAEFLALEQSNPGLREMLLLHTCSNVFHALFSCSQILMNAPLTEPATTSA